MKNSRPMTLGRLIVQEIKYNKGHVLLAVFAVAVAGAGLALSVGVIRGFDVKTNALVTALEADAQEQMDTLEAASKRELLTLENEMRKKMKGLGFNIFIFPEGQDLSEVYSKGYASKTMPEEFVTRLAESRIMSVNHLLPSLTRRINWAERGNRTIVLIGIRGEVPFSHRSSSNQKPLVDPVPPGKAVLGFELHNSLGITPGQTITINGHSVVVHECNDVRGSIDDITVWISLAEAQAALDMKGRINAILALECNCGSMDLLGRIRKEIHEILPKTTIIEKKSRALARAEARMQAKMTHFRLMEEQETSHGTRKAQLMTKRHEMKEQRGLFAMIFNAIAGVLAMAWIAYLTYVNTKERTQETGILVAIGISPAKILSAMVVKALVVGVVGTVVASGLALGFGATFFQESLGGLALFQLVSVDEIVTFVLSVPVLTCAAAWIPAIGAVNKDPAVTLRAD